MSAECERVFSSAKLLITPNRNRLSPDTVEWSECLRNWYNNGVIWYRRRYVTPVSSIQVLTARIQIYPPPCPLVRPPSSSPPPFEVEIALPHTIWLIWQISQSKANREFGWHKQSKSRPRFALFALMDTLHQRNSLFRRLSMITIIIWRAWIKLTLYAQALHVIDDRIIVLGGPYSTSFLMFLA